MSPRSLAVTLALVAAAAAAAAAAAPADPSTALRDFVYAPDQEYAWHDTGYRINGTGWRGVLLNVTSQAWLSEAEVTPSVWTHQMLVVVPDALLNTDSAVLWITGGKNGQGPPGKHDSDLTVVSDAAVQGGTVAVSLYQVPNQPIKFSNDDHGPRTESTLLPFTFRRFLDDTSRPELCILLPMVRAAVRAMDAVQEYALGAGVGNITRFTVTGASKRGWTSWLTAAVDPRVAAVAPVVFDMLNFDANVLHQQRLLGGWSFVLKEYVKLNLTRDFGRPEVVAPLTRLIDPLQYKAALSMPKMVVDATGDEFFMIDDDRYWWGQLPGPTYRLMVQNAEHSMATGLGEAVGALSAFHQAVWRGLEVPRMEWDLDQASGRLELTAYQKPSRVTLYGANTVDHHRRDFRLVTGDTPHNPCKGRGLPIKVFGDPACLVPLVWIGVNEKPASQGNGTYTYVATPQPPAHGWHGTFYEATFPGPGGTEFRLTSQVSIVPDVFPFPACRNTTAGCEGYLV